MSSKPEIIRPSEVEEAEINRGIAADRDTFIPSDEQFAQMKRRGGRANIARPHALVTVRSDADVVESLRTQER
jgi:uncharacterized protein (DUF4415 family)